MNFEVGAFIRGKHRIEKPLGHGGMVQNDHVARVIDFDAVEVGTPFIDTKYLEGTERPTLRRLDPTEAVSLWQELAESRWSLVDQLDHAGRRYLVARRNPPPAPATASLTESERIVLEWASLGHPKKLIGYELGISSATVSNRLSRAARKLGARNHLEAARGFRTQGHLAPTAPPDLAAVEVSTPHEDLAIVGFPSAAASLTEAEREVLLALVQGQSNEEIASARGVALRTVANQVAALFKKLGVGSRAELGMRWLEVLRR